MKKKIEIDHLKEDTLFNQIRYNKHLKEINKTMTQKESEDIAMYIVAIFGKDQYENIDMTPEECSNLSISAFRDIVKSNKKVRESLYYYNMEWLLDDMNVDYGL